MTGRIRTRSQRSSCRRREESRGRGISVDSEPTDAHQQSRAEPQPDVEGGLTTDVELVWPAQRHDQGCIERLVRSETEADGAAKRKAQITAEVVRGSQEPDGGRRIDVRQVDGERSSRLAPDVSSTGCL